MATVLKKSNSKIEDKYGCDTRMERLFKKGEGLFNVCMAKFAGIGPFSICTGMNDGSDFQLAKDMVTEYNELKDLVLDYDETVRYHTDKLDELQKEMQRINNKLDNLISLQKENNKKTNKD